MTRQEFISYSSKQLGFENFPYRSDFEVDTYIKNRLGITKTDFVINFLYSGGINGDLSFCRREIKSGDILQIRLYSITKFTFWRDDIEQYVSEITVISNCASLIEEFFISEDGRFWNKDNELRAENEEEFFDYLANVEYDFHPVISSRTYDILRHFGWYEGRHIDLTKFNSEMKKRGFELSEQQLAFFSEFSGLEVLFIPSDHDWRFFSLDEELDMAEPEFFDGVYDGSIMPGEIFIQIGFVAEAPLYLSLDGKIFGMRFIPLGRTPLESINNLVNNIPENYTYYC